MMHRIPSCRWHLLRIGLMVLLVALVTRPSPATADDAVEQGRDLFEHKWVANDPLTPAGDGLGPVYNADSCIACHHQGGSGGAGPAEYNVELMTLIQERGSFRKRPALQTKAGKLHPAFAPGQGGAATVMLHKFGTDPGYERWRLSVLGFKLPFDAESPKADEVRQDAVQAHESAPAVARVPRSVGLPLPISRRNTPALFGAGLIDAISDKSLQEVARAQAEQFPEVEGRVAVAVDGKIGRFGRRGQ